MQCWHCERPAHGVCRFCGRALCREHAELRPNIVGLYGGERGPLHAVVVSDTLYCGVCRPEEEPVILNGEP